MNYSDFKIKDNYGTHKTWVSDKGFKISSYIASQDDVIRAGMKYGKPFYCAYYGEPLKNGGYQFGWHVNRETPYYQTRKAAIAAINQYIQES